MDAELERNLQPETPVAQRCKTLRELGDAVKANKLEDVNFLMFFDPFHRRNETELISICR